MTSPALPARQAPPGPDGWLRRKLLQPLRAQMAQGCTPEKLALSIACGITLGLSPLFGITTLLCVLLAMALRLNHPAIQLANQAMYLVQIPLLVIFVRVGEALLDAPPAALSPSGLLLRWQHGPLAMVEGLGRSGLHGLLGWAVAAPLLAATTYAVLITAFRRPRAAA